ncbi:hypothetical protein AgCh_001238 [Apium graveolens]
MSFDLQIADIRLLRSCNISEIYQLGASFSDTGNRLVEDPLTASSRLPYGESSFQGPTGRFSDGLLMIDYIGKNFSLCCIAQTGSHFVLMRFKPLRVDTHGQWSTINLFDCISSGIPLLNPYLEDNANFGHGVNFAVGGATALSTNALAVKNITTYSTKSSLVIYISQIVVMEV